MAFVGPLDAFNSKPIQTKVGKVTADTKPIFTATSTKVTRDSSGKVTGGTTTLYYSATPGNYVPAATTTDGGKTWTYLKDSNGKEILGADAKNSLQTGALKNNTQQQIVSATTKPLGGLSKEEQKVVAPSTKNDATVTEEANTDGSVPKEFTTEDQQKTDELLRGLQSAIQSKSRGVGDYENVTYPLTLDTSTQDIIQFTMLEHAPRKTGTSDFANGNFFGDRNRDDVKSRGATITLPIQPSITDSNTVNWTGQSITALEAMEGIAAASAISSGGTGVAAALKGGAQLLQNKAANDSMKSSIALGYASTNKNFLTKTTGAIQNPNLELLFDSPSLRQFSFTFVMSAREDDESQAIRRIIRFFKQGMSVQRASTGLFLKSPNTFDIKYKYKSNDHPYLNKIKECALINFSVDYTPAGNYSTYDNGAMTLYALSMQFQELDPIYNDDYDKLGKESIGY